MVPVNLCTMYKANSMFILTVWCAILTVNWSLIMSTLQAKQPEGCSWACLFDTITIKIQLIFISKSTINSRSTYPTHCLNVARRLDVT